MQLLALPVPSRPSPAGVPPGPHLSDTWQGLPGSAAGHPDLLPTWPAAGPSRPGRRSLPSDSCFALQKAEAPGGPGTRLHLSPSCSRRVSAKPCPHPPPTGESELPAGVWVG